jgi:uncharacterized membrane protein YjgN (DUF898 family)
MIVDIVPADRLPPSPVVWRGRGSIWAVLLRNLALNIVTLGFYRFWARTRLRRYLWGNVEILGDPLVYTGTGMELFKGFLVALCFLGPLLAAYFGIQFAFADRPALSWSLNAGLYALFYLLIQVAVYRARRYRLARTQWRGIRFGQDGSSWRYMMISVLWGLATVVTLGIAAPWAWVAQQRYLMTHTLLGDRRFSFAARGSALVGEWLIVFVTMGVGYIWYAVVRFRYFVLSTALGRTRARSTLTSGFIYLRVAFILVAILVLYALVIAGIVAFAVQVARDVKAAGGDGGDINTVLKTILRDYGVYLAVGTFLFGVAVSAVMQIAVWSLLYIPILRRICATLTLQDIDDLNNIGQAAAARPGAGEGLADAFDVGLG